MSPQRLQIRTQGSQIPAPKLQESLRMLGAPILKLNQGIRKALETNPMLQEKDPSFEPEAIRLDENTKPRGPAEQSDHDPTAKLESQTSLGDHLLGQVAFIPMDEDTREALEILIGDLDENGFRTSENDTLAKTFTLPIELLDKAQSILEKLEPAGIGAKDTRHCLLLQLTREDPSESLAAKILAKMPSVLLKADPERSAKRLKVSPAEVRHALERISKLNPRPASQFQNHEKIEIAPDLLFYKSKDIWKVRLYQDELPELCINDTYRRMIAEGKAEERKAWFKNQLQAAHDFIAALEHRALSLQRIGEALIQHQHAFLDHGVEQLAPLSRETLAEELQLHGSTLSRAIAHKYARVSNRLIPLARFFSAGKTSKSGVKISKTSAQEHLRQAIQAENPKRPLSDAALAEALQAKGIELQRRTITKYRRQLNIPESRARRQA